MSVAIRTATRLQDQDDVNVTLGAGVDEYALCWDNDTARFVLRAVSAGVTDHGALTGLADDDHSQYALLAGRSGGSTLYGGTAANDDIVIHGTSNATRTTSYVILQPTAGNVGIGTTTPAALLEIKGALAKNGMTVWGGASGFDAVGVQVDQYGTLTHLGKSTASMAAGYADIVPGDTYGRVAIGLDNGVPFIAFGPGTATRDVFLRRESGALALQMPSGTELFRFASTGRLGIGTTAPGSLLHALLTSAATNAVTNVLTVGHDTSGTAAAGFGAGQLFSLESSTTAAQSAARIQALWNDATHATRKADLVLTAYDTAEREGLRIRGNGSAAAIGFLGATPAARIAHVADPSGGGTVDAEARSAINSILATLETFGFHATS